MNKKTNALIRRLCLGPYSVWAALFIVVPLLFVAYYAFTDEMDEIGEVEIADLGDIEELGEIRAESEPKDE